MYRYKLFPKIFIAYDRIAFYKKSDSNLRITFDDNIRFRQTDIDLRSGNCGRQLMDPSQFLMEIKFSDSIPFWLAELLNDLKVYPVSFSKYGYCYKKFILSKERVVKCSTVSSTQQQRHLLQLR